MQYAPLTDQWYLLSQRSNSNVNKNSFHLFSRKLDVLGREDLSGLLINRHEISLPLARQALNHVYLCNDGRTRVHSLIDKRMHPGLSFRLSQVSFSRMRAPAPNKAVHLEAAT